jgi:hypothetical protein
VAVPNQALPAVIGALVGMFPKPIFNSANY